MTQPSNDLVIILNPEGCGNPRCAGCYPLLAMAEQMNEIRCVPLDEIVAETRPTHEAPERKQ